MEIRTPWEAVPTFGVSFGEHNIGTNEIFEEPIKCLYKRNHTFFLELRQDIVRYLNFFSVPAGKVLGTLLSSLYAGDLLKL